ncbi:gephyrin-like molybdotransferase Glp [Leekyejoonella antrihumi]|uniref:Molybdopterin molybdenumtransferase n=1 Tax=Leekyejoonella antrihumi TaxID=1660198 RepID=A0A563E865_9MICO|nr:gephyrin-like molybdotransferase Glp [Leekyejoonella antrihumi]TWP38635.1 molybdopterin molybdotransferase MoeA [Leekyejoonella antrihumi]
MLTVPAYQERLLEAVAPLTPVAVSVLDAGQLLGLVTTDEVRAVAMLPGFTNSAMDGYAVRAADVSDAPVTLPVSGDIAAGDTRRLRLEPGTCWRIMTGAPLPDGADSVVQVELTDGGTTDVRIDARVESGASVRYPGEDVQPGQVVLAAGTQLAAQHVPVLLSAGVQSVRVRPRPRVAVVSTGDELRPAGSELEHGQVTDSNGPMLAALAVQAGFDVVAVQHVGDSGPSTRAMLHGLADAADAIITSGGVSAGAFEPLRLAFEDDQSLEFVKVAMQPGKPQAFGSLGGTPVFGLPGNPVSSFVSFLVFVAPALRKMAGRPVDARTVRCEVARGWQPAAPGRTQVARIRMRPDGRIEQAGGPGSHLMGGLATAEGLAFVPADLRVVREGEVLEVIEFHPDEGPRSQALVDTSRGPRNA